MIQSLKALFGAFAVEATDDVLRGYVLGVGDIEPEKLQAAVYVSIRECDHLPRPVELRRLAGEHAGPKTLAIAAWGDVMRSLPLGPWKAVDFQDRRINAAVRLLGGWPTFIGRFTDAESEKWLRVEFLSAYESVATRNLDGDVCRPLVGLSEKQCVGGKIIDPQPVRIGCEALRRISGPSRNQTGVIRAD